MCPSRHRGFRKRRCAHAVEMLISNRQQPVTSVSAPCKMPKISSARNRDRRCIKSHRTMRQQWSLVSQAFCLPAYFTRIKPDAANQKRGCQAQANASPSLYSTIRSKISQALCDQRNLAEVQQPLVPAFWAQNGVGWFWCKQRRDNTGDQQRAINQYMPCQPSHLSASHRASRRKPASLNGNPER